MAGEVEIAPERIHAELRRRLEEAEETIRDIRDGEVDALVMRNLSNEDEVFTLEGGTESYRAFMEAMEIGAAAFDASGRLLYANHALLQLFGASREAIDTRTLLSKLDPAAAERVSTAISTARASKSTAEITLASPQGERHLQLTAAPLRMGNAEGVAVTFTDITSRIRELAAQESERAAHAILSSANEAVIVCNTRGIVTHANAAVLAIANGDPVGQSFDEAFAIVVPDATGLMRGEDLVALAIGGTPVQGVEAHAPHAPRVRDLLVSAAPLRLSGNRTAGCVVTMVDLSSRKAAEKQQLLLMGELDHRVKNTLALVLSIANRTASTEDSVQGFQTAFSSRIRALAATHNILAERSWSAVSIGDIVRTELEPYVTDMQSRLDIRGDRYGILPRAAIALGLVLHELATNAVKYGSLSVPTGHVTVTIDSDPERPGLCLDWKEHGGPHVAQPQRKGFGQTVITKSMQYSQDGGAELDYAPDGLFCRVMIPRADVVSSDSISKG